MNMLIVLEMNTIGTGTMSFVLVTNALVLETNASKMRVQTSHKNTHTWLATGDLYQPLKTGGSYVITLPYSTSCTLHPQVIYVIVWFVGLNSL